MTSSVIADFAEYEATLARGGGTFDSFVSAESEPVADFPPLKKIESALKPVPALPFNILPSAFRDYVEDTADRMQVAPDYIAVTIMVALSAVVGRKVAIYPKQKDNWLVVPNLWGGVVGRPSTKKTPSMADALRPINKLEEAARRAYKAAENAYKVEKELHDIAAGQAKNAAKKSLSDEGEDAARDLLLAHRKTEPVQPTRKRYKTNSTTIEKLGELFAENPNGILVIRDELTGFFAELEKTGQESARSGYLEAWSGNGGFTYDRVGRGTVDITAACVSILGGIQPAKLKPFVDQAIKGDAGDDGLLQRFQILVYPDKPATQWVDRLPSSMAEQKAFDVFERLDAIEAEEQIKLRFGSDAQAAFIEWCEELDTKTGDPDIPPAIESHLDKYRSMVPSLALLIHLADSGSDLFEPVEVTPLMQALAWAEYLEAHMHRIYGLSESMDEDNAIKIARRFGGKLGVVFTLRDVLQANWQGIGRNKHKAQAAIDVLEQHGYIMPEVRESNGRPTTDYYVNPDAVGIHG